MKQTILEIEVVKEMHSAVTYKVTYMNQSYTVTKVGSTFNYIEEEINGIPEQVIDFVEDWIAEKF